MKLHLVMFISSLGKVNDFGTHIHEKIGKPI